MNYYPPTLSLSSVIRQFPELELVDTAEQQRLQDIEDRKKRGKGAPKKAKSKGQSLLRFPPILPPDFSSAISVPQPIAGVLQGNGRGWADGIFGGKLLESLLSNFEYINSTSRPTFHSISAWSSTVDSRCSAIHLFPSPPHNPPPPSNASCSLHFPRYRKANPRPLHSHDQRLIYRQPRENPPATRR